MNTAQLREYADKLHMDWDKPTRERLLKCADEIDALRSEVRVLTTPMECSGCREKWPVVDGMHNAPSMSGLVVPCCRSEVAERNAEMQRLRVELDKRTQELREANSYTASLHSQIIELQDLIAKQQWGLDLEGPVGCPWCKAEWGRVDDPPPPHDANCEAAKAMRWPMAT